MIKRGVIPLSYLKPSWDNGLAGQLSKFTLMALITSVTLPVAYIMMRKLLAAQYSWDEVGIWQGVSSISDAYLQFITGIVQRIFAAHVVAANGKARYHPGSG
ncbi:Protein wzxE [Escherichia coli]|uniref:Protein wzxE n=1 Tax=Escherichia coli TaxID=562 RepID=A0A376RS79_ECOLX|nr:Protein wzxE [Escherichia coli]